jgi:glutathione S-transferase
VRPIWYSKRRQLATIPANSEKDSESLRFIRFLRKPVAKISSGMLEEYPNLSAYVARGEARPAYKRAFAAQLAVVTAKRPTG